MKKILILTVLFLALSVRSMFATFMLPYHIAGVVVGEGLGWYSSITSVMYGQSDWTKAAAIVNMTLLVSQAALGTLTILGVGDYTDMLLVHRIVGFSVLAASIWLSVSATLDKGLNQGATPYTSYGYSAVSVVPVIVYSFIF